MLLAVALVLAFRTHERRWIVRSAVFAVLSAAFGAAFAMHVSLASSIVSPHASPSAAVLSLLTGWNLQSLAARFAAPGSYLAFPYGFGLLPPFLMLFLQLPGFWHSLRPSPARFAVLGYAVSWLLFTLVIGTMSTYWGQEFLPLAVVGSGLSLACADGILADVSAALRRMREARGRVARRRATVEDAA